MERTETGLCGYAAAEAGVRCEAVPIYTFVILRKFLLVVEFIFMYES